MEPAEWKDSCSLDLQVLCEILSCSPTALPASYPSTMPSSRFGREGAEEAGNDFLQCPSSIKDIFWPLCSFGLGHLERKLIK